MVASISGTKPWTMREPACIGSPATQMVSFTPTRIPWSGPADAPSIRVRTVQAKYGFSSADGRQTGPRGYLTSGLGSWSSSMRPQEWRKPRIISR